MTVGDGRVRGVVLAGGQSTRFGDDDKALAPLDGEPLISHVVSALYTAVETRPLLAARTDERAVNLLSVLPRLPTVVDDDRYEGPVAGLFAAAEAVSEPWFVVVGCDMPLISRAAIRTLLSNTTSETGAVVACDDTEMPEPLLAAYRTTAVRQLQTNSVRIESLRDVLDALSEVRLLHVDAHPVFERAVTNVNTQNELTTLRRAALH
ncbi:molybdopterin-guanine dinucleotide biosynthesis protein A [Halogranum amylolyticum]|uniref:Probable molybdenum cofactor guanylyltransferase n=1 Tax=Halogranum amylolyticum TaxID=660520 RepID=A0A1H8UR18_9EURY|nr:molybdenum cofactor guanylyltransferase [Halogranum amylolyticum]SEP05642.1 molybdopterin-guanine dinucleotide biosynthesis protein A [Halogranum amylolyticum]